MSTYVTLWDEHVQRAATFVHTPQAKVTYQGDNGSKFRVLVTQKPNPIGFRAVLPGGSAEVGRAAPSKRATENNGQNNGRR